MEPRIQYAQTTDGVSIAFWTLGEGAPLVEMPTIPVSHIQMEWQIPEWRRWYEPLARTRTVVRYDCRGAGLSDRDVTDFSLEAQLLDLQAVVSRLPQDKLALLAPIHAGPVAIAYAARNPERVSHLCLWHSWARTRDAASSPQFAALARLRNTDWEMYSETVAHTLLGWSEGEPAHRYAELMRECIAPETLNRALAAFAQFDVADLLPELKVPTLVLHRRELSWLSADVARGLASRIPDARLAFLEGGSGAGFLGDTDAVLRTLHGFLGEAEEPAVWTEPMAADALRTILFTDVEGSTALTQRLGDAEAREVLRAHERIVRDALRAHGALDVKALGDGFMASFSSATRALECAIAIQRACAEHNQTAAEPARVRIGLNAGEPIAEEKDLYGTAVNLAARIAARAEGGEILASDVVRQLVAGKRFLFRDRGAVELRGFEDPVRLYEVRWEE
ncbi:MAG TPA: adenylate/guanylate cyclase domain-containing protein [Dehalococcoidia bacterium]|nr:adenylate/guanylate cyclase domain-containing protein [Dehalococcoidia bacterium]